MDAMVTESCSTGFLLPRLAYDDLAWFEREQRSVCGRTWSLVATTDQLGAPGDYVARDVGGLPVVVLRDEQGDLRGFQNLCRHRGMVMVDGCGSAPGGLRCFYHDWRYALDGSLRVVPQRKEQFADLDLA